MHICHPTGMTTTEMMEVLREDAASFQATHEILELWMVFPSVPQNLNTRKASHLISGA